MEYVSFVILGIVAVTYIVFAILKLLTGTSIGTLENNICKKLDEQGFRHEKKDGTLYVVKNDQTFHVHFWDTSNKWIIRLYFVYDFGDEYKSLVSNEGWAVGANYINININNPHSTFISYKDSFCCRFETAIANSKDFMREFDTAYQIVGQTMEDFNKLHSRLERDYPNDSTESKIGFR